MRGGTESVVAELAVQYFRRDTGGKFHSFSRMVAQSVPSM
jgi:hypothetical protein